MTLNQIERYLEHNKPWMIWCFIWIGLRKLKVEYSKNQINDGNQSVFIKETENIELSENNENTDKSELSLKKDEDKFSYLEKKIKKLEKKYSKLEGKYEELEGKNKELEGKNNDLEGENEQRKNEINNLKIPRSIILWIPLIKNSFFTEDCTIWRFFKIRKLYLMGNNYIPKF